MNRKTALTLAGLTTAALVALGCGAGSDAETGTTGDKGSAPAAGSAPADTKANNKPAAFGKQTKTINDGLVIATGVPALYKPSDTAALSDPKAKAFKVKVTITNNTNAAVDLTSVTMTGTLGADGTTADRVFDSAKSIGDFEGVLTPGKNKSATVAFAAVTTDVSVCTLEVAVGYGGQTADFEGKPAK